MRLFLGLFVVAATTLVAPAFADSEYDACISASDGTNMAWDACGSALIEREDRRLNVAWTLLTPKLEPATKKALLDEQRAWIAFKDKSCLFYADGTLGREGQVLSYPTCRAEVIAERAKALKAISDEMSGR